MYPLKLILAAGHPSRQPEVNSRDSQGFTGGYSCNAVIAVAAHYSCFDYINYYYYYYFDYDKVYYYDDDDGDGGGGGDGGGDGDDDVCYS